MYILKHKVDMKRFDSIRYENDMKNLLLNNFKNTAQLDKVRNTSKIGLLPTALIYHGKRLISNKCQKYKNLVKVCEK